MALEKKFTLKNFYSQMDKQITGIDTLISSQLASVQVS